MIHVVYGMPFVYKKTQKGNSITEKSQKSLNFRPESEFWVNASWGSLAMIWCGPFFWIAPQRLERAVLWTKMKWSTLESEDLNLHFFQQLWLLSPKINLRDHLAQQFKTKTELWPLQTSQVKFCIQNLYSYRCASLQPSVEHLLRVKINT